MEMPGTSPLPSGPAFDAGSAFMSIDIFAPRCHPLPGRVTIHGR